MKHSGYSVLIIDDSSDDITLLERFLSRSIIPIRALAVARKAAEGLEKIRSEPPDFVIVGDSCSDMGRLELLKRLSEIASGEILPTLCLVNDEAVMSSQSFRAHHVGVVKKSMLTPEKLRDAMLTLIEQAETKVEKNRAETLFALLAENSDDAIALTDDEGVLVAANENYLNLFASEAAGVGQKVEMKDYDQLFFKSAHAACSKMWRDDKEGNRVELEVKRLFIEERGRRAFMLSIYKTLQTEIVEQNRNGATQTASASSDETNLIRQLERIHKNALHTALIILRAKAKRVLNSNFEELLQEHNRRIQIIVAASERVRASESRLVVSARQLVENVFETFQKSPLTNANVAMKQEVEKFWVDFSDAVLIGLILNELIANALTHAFNSRGGSLAVSFFKERDETIVLTVRDSGVGAPFRIETKPPAAMGLIIVSSLTKRLNGKMEMKRHIGTTIRIAFAQKRASTEGSPETTAAGSKRS